MVLPTTKLVRSVEDVTQRSVASSFFGKGKLSRFILVTDLSLAEILSKIMLYSQTYSAVVSRVVKQKTFNNFSVQKETYLRTHYFYFNAGKFV